MLLLEVRGAMLALVHVSSSDPLPRLGIKNKPIETSFVKYILQQYTDASDGQKFQNSIKNAYAMGKLNMITSELQTTTRTITGTSPMLRM
ncbi:unnamed protein product [Eruca vesicaria subsp. sativa]|uniref:Uncharacterized protein n=1 Tax=Eruca vesicaria subsp. sativa TaxID=29727 RepID=A0ABC8KYC3_ERUVS|nr:unnamed protein product [Eruca vesicaria subsp. sativa]